MAKEPKKLDELFHDTLKDIYFAEKKILSALPKMAKAAQNLGWSEPFGCSRLHSKRRKKRTKLYPRSQRPASTRRLSPKPPKHCSLNRLKVLPKLAYAYLYERSSTRLKWRSWPGRIQAQRDRKTKPI
jgi:hypothetical protein